MIYPRFKLWLETESGDFLLGEGTCLLLEEIEKSSSLSEAARTCSISYAHAWKKIRKVESQLGQKLVDKSRGGTGGGRSTLTEVGKNLTVKFRELEDKTRESIETPEDI